LPRVLLHFNNCLQVLQAREHYVYNINDIRDIFATECLLKDPYAVACFVNVGWASGMTSGLYKRVVKYWHGYLSGARCK